MKIVRLFVVTVLASGIAYGLFYIRRGFSANDKPTSVERVVARTVRNLAIPSRAANEKNPLKPTEDFLQEARDRYIDHCVNCHGNDGGGRSEIGEHLYPKAPDLRLPATQSLADGEIRYIIRNGVRLTGMPAWSELSPESRNEATDDGSWKLVLYIRSLASLTPAEKAEQETPSGSAQYVGSQACEKCHADIYQRWKKTPMANVVRDPKEHPDAIIPDLATNKVAKFTKDQVAFVYGSIWKQRYFTKVGDDYYPLSAQWDVVNKMWRPYMVAKGTDWWEPLYPADNMQRPTGPTCDGCHSVDYNVQTRKVAEWNVGCERCHGPGSGHVAHPTRGNVRNPARMNYVEANDTCIQCHSQGRPLKNPIEGRYYDWPVGYEVGRNLRDYWQLEEHKLGEQTFTHFPDGTGHKNRMQGNDFIQSAMYKHGVTCFSCHDAHGTSNYAQLRKPASRICMECHSPESVNGPRAATLEAHTHHKTGSAGSECVACHMPKIEMTVADVKVRAHTFAFITPAMTDTYKIPNPCTTCHADKSTAWASEELRRWPERSPWRMQ